MVESRLEEYLSLVSNPNEAVHHRNCRHLVWSCRSCRPRHDRTLMKIKYSLPTLSNSLSPSTTPPLTHQTDINSKMSITTPPSPSSPIDSTRSSTRSSTPRTKLSLDLSNLPHVVYPDPPSNTIIITVSSPLFLSLLLPN